MRSIYLMSGSIAILYPRKMDQIYLYRLDQNGLQTVKIAPIDFTPAWEKQGWSLTVPTTEEAIVTPEPQPIEVATPLAGATPTIEIKPVQLEDSNGEEEEEKTKRRVSRSKPVE